MNHSVAIVAMARLENPYINEWISYHIGLGVSHIYIYDNSCGDEQHIDLILTEENKVNTTIIPAYNKVRFQKKAYNEAYTRFNDKHDYMMFIDIDEFFTLCKHKTIQEYIDYLNERCPNFQSARIHWEVYDDNNTIERDVNVPVHEFFTQKSNTIGARKHNFSTKCLIKTKIPGQCMRSVHFSSCLRGALKTCNSIGKVITPKNQYIQERDVSVAKIRHYVTKTISEYMMHKLSRDDADCNLIRDIGNRFFFYCNKTPDKVKFYQEHQNLINKDNLVNTSQLKSGFNFG